MLRRPLAWTIWVVALLGTPAAADAQSVVRPSSVTARTTVPAGGSATLALTCPSPGVALNAAITRRGSAVTVRRSVPGAGASDWSFRLRAQRGGGSRRVAAVLRCVRLAAVRGISGARLFVSTRTARNTAVPAGETMTFRLGCGRAWLGTGWAFSPGTRTDVRVAAVVPTAHGWRFRVENTGTRPARPVVSARCLRRVVSSDGGERLAFRVNRRTFSDTVGPGVARFSHRCGPGQFSVATGSAVDASAPIVLTGSYPSAARGGSWSYTRAGADEQVASFLVCLARGSRFA